RKHTVEPEPDVARRPALAPPQLPYHAAAREGDGALAEQRRVDEVREREVTVELEDGHEVQRELEDEQARGLERDAARDAAVRHRHERAERAHEQTADRSGERHDDARTP